MDLGRLTEHLRHQRWFAGKGREWEVTGSSTLGWLRYEMPAVRIELVHVRYGDGEVDTYQLPLVHHGQPVDHLSHAFVAEDTDEEGRRTWLYDALQDKDVTWLWTAGIDRASSAPATAAASESAPEAGTGAGVVFHRSPGSPTVPVSARSIVISAEQSNTSLVFGDSAILKVFRRLSPGINPDIEVHEALAAAGSTYIASPMGWLGGSWRDPVSGEQVEGSLAMLQVFLRDATEGWESAKASVRDLLAEGDLHADEVGGDFAGDAARLGAATARVHADLAATLGSRVLDRGALADLADGMRQRLERACAEVDQLLPYQKALNGAFDALARHPGPVLVQRVHGDLHLGQVMRTLAGWTLLDFEGEPSKSLTERRAMDSPLKDVAGMLRSFDYASRQPLGDRGAPKHLEYRAAEWAERNRDAFCTGYGKASGQDPREDAILLSAFETDKVIYEVIYEARNRPTWLRIPLSAIERLASAR